MSGKGTGGEIASPEVPKDIVESVMLPGESVVAGPLPARLLEVYDGVEPVTGMPTQSSRKLMSVEDCLLLATNRRFIVARSGVSYYSSVSLPGYPQGAQSAVGESEAPAPVRGEGLAPSKTGWRLTIFPEAITEKARDVSFSVGFDALVYAIPKGSVSVNLRVGKKATGYFQTRVRAELIVQVLFALFVTGLVIHFLVTLISGNPQWLDIVALIAGFIAVKYLSRRRVFILNPTVFLEGGGEVTIINRVTLTEESVIVRSNGSERREERLVTKTIAIRVSLKESASLDEVLAFVSGLLEEAG